MFGPLSAAWEVPVRTRRNADPGSLGLLDGVNRFPVTAVTLMAAVVLSLAHWKEYPLGPLFMTSDAYLSQPWRLFTSTLLHGDWLHLAFNAYWIWHLGRWVENGFGRMWALGLGATLAAGSSAAQFALSGGGIGLSGIVYGLFGFLWVLGRRDPAFRGAVDQSTTQLFVVWFFLCIALTIGGVWNIANVAHGSGAVIGFLVGNALYPHRRGALRWYASVAGTFAGIWVLGTFARPWVNFGEGMSREFFDRAYSASGRGDDEEAARLYQETLDRDGENDAAAFNLGLSLARMGRLEESLAAYDRAIELAPDDPDGHRIKGRALNNLGRALNGLGRHLEALSAYEHGLSIDPRDTDMRVRIGWTLGLTGQVVEGLSVLADVISNDPRNADAQGFYGVLLLDVERPEEALEALDLTVELEPDSAWNHDMRAQALEELSRFDEAAAAYGRSIELDPTDASTHLFRAWCLSDAERFEESLESASQAVELDPEDPEGHLCRGMALIELDRHLEALGACDTALELDPTNAEALATREDALAGL
jgi:tetratricopeptide (TPR) repeat protein